MEIDEAVRGCSDRRMRTKYGNAVYVVQRAFALYPFEEVAFSFNGGKDSTVLLHLIRAGYYLYKKDAGDVAQMDAVKNCPLRTIYFESPCAFPEINSFTYETVSTYGLPLETIHSDFKSGLEGLLKEKPTKAIFIGTRIGDPNAVGQEQFSPSSPGWPPFMRVNPILDWSYRYTSIGSIHDTVPNALLSDSSTEKSFRPAYMLTDGRLERAGRTKKTNHKMEMNSVASNGMNNIEGEQMISRAASIIVVGDEILFGTTEDKLGAALCKKLHAIGWRVSHVAVVRNEIDSVAEEVERCKSTDDMVFIFGGLGPLHSDISLAGVAKAFGVRLAPDEEFEDYLSQLMGNNYTGDRNEMALLPEGITELLHHKKLPLPLIKCRNVITLAATNVDELDTEWDCLLDTQESGLVQAKPFVSKHLGTTLSDVQIAPVLAKLCLEFSDVYIGCHRISRAGPLVVNLTGKDNQRVEAAAEKLTRSFEGQISQVDSCK
ncbi:FAD synthase [Panicum miliaceum]|uniref:FAD synthase n=1 Tax=Panicum miliaceum TaxID=4540 RepID=A0A3L6R224_PANMI|nr:FAD synthase [Panicum miliaceum]